MRTRATNLKLLNSIRGGGKYHEERKLNLETFGQANPNGGGSGNNAKGGNHRHRGGRGGRGGRGFHRGGSGGGKSNNKQLGPNKNQNGSNIVSVVLCICIMRRMH